MERLGAIKVWHTYQLHTDYIHYIWITYCLHVATYLLHHDMLYIQLHSIYIPYTYNTSTSYENYIHNTFITYTLYTDYLYYICYIWITYRLHTNYIQVTYENWSLQFLHMLRVIYIQFTYVNRVAYILHTIDTYPLKKSTKASWLGEAIFESRYFIANCRTGLRLAGQGRSKPPRKIGDASNAATKQEATEINPQ